MKRHHFFGLLMISLFVYTAVKDRVDRGVVTRNKKELRLLPNTTAAQFMAIGFKPALADLYWIEGLNYFGSELLSKVRTYEYLPKYFELIATLDPLFKVFYDWAATAYIYNGLDVDRDAVLASTRILNRGIAKMHEFGRYDADTIQKGAFNYALEVHVFAPALSYFEMAARSFPEKRDLLLVASSYAELGQWQKKAYELKLEYLGFVALEAQKKEEIMYALGVLTSPKFNSYAGAFTRALRLTIEKDEDVRKLVEKRLNDHPFFQSSMLASDPIDMDPRFRRLLELDTSKNWMPPALHLLLKIY